MAVMTHGSLLPAALLALVQDSSALRFEPPKGWDRREDPARGQVILSPPNLSPGGECVVLIYPPQDFQGPAQAYLDAVVGNASTGNRVKGKVQSTDAGSFRRATFVQTTPQGVTQHLAIYAAQWGQRAQAALFVSTDGAIFKKQLVDVEKMIQGVKLPDAGAPAAASAPAVAIAGMLLPLPADWARQTDPSGWTIVTPPPQLGSGNPRIFIAPSGPLRGTHWGTHRTILKGLMDSAKWEGGMIRPSSSVVGSFILSDASRNDGPFDQREMKLYTAAVGKRVEAVAVAPVGGGEFLRALHSILERTTFKDAPAKGPKRPEVVEAYRRANQKKFINIDGSFYYGSLMYERIFLYGNGVADFSSSYDEGLGGSPFVPQVDVDCLNGFYGRWKADGKTVRLLREASGSEEVYERENGNLRFGDQVWIPNPRVDGLRLKGRYGWKSGPKDALQYNYWVEFTEKSELKSGGLLPWLAITDLTGRPKPPETVSGTYEIRDWTLWVLVNGSPIWSTDFMLLKEDAKDLGTVLIHTYAFKRE